MTELPKDLQKALDDQGIAYDPSAFPWHKRLWLKFFPSSFLKNAAREQGIDDDAIDMSTKLFEGKEVHIHPFGADNRGFMITIDRKFSIWFFQDGDHFQYDGFEMGEYEPGAVTVFDSLNREK